MKAERNKTIELTKEEEKDLLLRTVRINSPAKREDVLDKTILGDCLAVMKKLPHGFADLIIADPPYNLFKDFGYARNIFYGNIHSFAHLFGKRK